MKAEQLLVYGATGFTAGLVVEQLLMLGVEPILSARDEAKLDEVVRRFGLEGRVARLDRPSALSAALRGVKVVLNCAGPFLDTAVVLARACIEARVHYVDVSGELDAIEQVSRFHKEARDAGVTLMCGAGFDVVPSDCLCAQAARELGSVTTLRLGISGLELASRGSVRTIARDFAQPIRVRRDGQLRSIPAGSLSRDFDFGAGPRNCVAVTWGDLGTAHLSTGATTVETYFEATPAVAAALWARRALGWWGQIPPYVAQMLEQQAALWTQNPQPDERIARSAVIAVHAEGAGGRVFMARLQTPEAYSLTARVAPVIAERFLMEELPPGFQTPSRLFGPDFILGFDGCL